MAIRDKIINEKTVFQLSYIPPLEDPMSKREMPRVRAKKKIVGLISSVHDKAMTSAAWRNGSACPSYAERTQDKVVGSSPTAVVLLRCIWLSYHDPITCLYHWNYGRYQKLT